MGVPWISVIIPCYNAEKYIDTCMASLFKQTIGMDKFEIILINDASCDRTLEKLCRYEKESPENILVINCEENRKQGYARNLGIQYSRAAYVTFLDADDCVACDMLAKMYQKIIEGSYDYVVCNYYRVIHGKPVIMEEEVMKEEICYVIDSEEKRREFLVTDLPINYFGGTLYNKTFLIEHDIFYPPDIFYEDLFLLGLLRFYAQKVLILPDRFYYYVDWGGALPSSQNPTAVINFNA